eukprot:2419276-Amphidinium_carterae.1
MERRHACVHVDQQLLYALAIRLLCQSLLLLTSYVTSIQLFTLFHTLGSAAIHHSNHLPPILECRWIGYLPIYQLMYLLTMLALPSPAKAHGLGCACARQPLVPLRLHQAPMCRFLDLVRAAFGASTAKGQKGPYWNC